MRYTYFGVYSIYSGAYNFICTYSGAYNLYAPILVHITLSRVQSHVQSSSAHACSYAPILVHM